MTDCSTLGAPNTLTLVFSGTTLGNYVHSLVSAIQPLDEIQKKSNYWASQAILDGRYRNCVYSHNFLVYVEKTDRFQYAQYAVSFADQFRGNAQELQLKWGSTAVMWFGNCWLDAVEPKQPQEMLLHEAGMLEFRFLGTVVTSVIV